MNRFKTLLKEYPSFSRGLGSFREICDEASDMKSYLALNKVVLEEDKTDKFIDFYVSEEISSKFPKITEVCTRILSIRSGFFFIK